MTEAAEIDIGSETESTIEGLKTIPDNWEPEILAFACHYCAFAAADLAGVMRLAYPANIKIIRLPCTGKIDHSYILRALERGVDGVFVAGCLEGQCHFLEGNLYARKRVDYIKTIIPDVKINPERVSMYNLSAAMGPKWAEICQEFTDKIKKIGPSPIRLAKIMNRTKE